MKSMVQISSKTHFCSLSVSKFRMKQEVGFTSKLLQILDDFQLYYMHIPAGVDTVQLILPETEIRDPLETEVTNRIQRELGADTVRLEDTLALLIVNAEHTPACTSRASDALARATVNIEWIQMSQFQAEVRLIFAVKQVDAARGLRALQDEFIAEVSDLASNG